MDWDRRDEDGRGMLPWSFLASLLLHAMFVPLLVAVFVQSFIEVPKIPEARFTGSVFTIQERVRPAIRPVKSRTVQQKTPAKPHVVRTAMPPRELAKFVPNAPPQPARTTPKPSLTTQIAEQEHSFAREAQRLHQNSVTIPTSAPGENGFRHYTVIGPKEPTDSFVFLTPTEHWFDGNLSCYYTNYDMTMSQGSEENGTIPWPVCYPRDADRMMPLDKVHYLPIPLPQRDFVLKPGTYLTPFLQSIYQQRPH